MVKIGEVATLLEGVAQGLEDLSKKTADGLTTLSTGMRMFSEQSVDQFVKFLQQCDEYANTGTFTTGRKTTPSKDKGASLSVADAATKVRQLLAEINQGAVTTDRINSLLRDLDKALKKPDFDQLLASLQIAGKSGAKKQAVEKIRQVLNSQLEMYVKAQSFRN